MAFSLGIDVGTSSVKAVVIDEATGNVLKEHSEKTNAVVPTDAVGGDEQSVAAILTTLDGVLGRLGTDLLQKVSDVTICGQMHGLVLWRHGTIGIREGAVDISSAHYSHLYTWQDNRCDRSFVDDLPSSAHGKIRSGYGCATVFWLNRRRSGLIGLYDRAGTVMDLVVTVLCDGEGVVMSDHNAYSWGYFNRHTCEWEREQ